MEEESKYYKLFISRVVEKFSDKFNLSLIPKNIKYLDKANIICQKHGIREITCYEHFYESKYGCPMCAYEGRINSLIPTEEEILKKIREKWGDEYTILSIDRDKKEVTFLCKKHGVQTKKIAKFLQGQGCKDCGKERCHTEKIFENLHKSTLKPKEKVFKELYEKYSDLYTFNEDSFIKASEYIECTCNKCGHSFKEKPSILLCKSNFKLCPNCSQKKSIYENKVNEFIRTFYKKDIRRGETLPFLSGQKNGHLTLDFYFPDLKTAIEVQGEQHFEPRGFSKKNSKYKYSNFEKQVINDELKYAQCIKNGINLIYFTEVKNIPKEFLDKHEYIRDFNLLKETILNLAKK